MLKHKEQDLGSYITAAEARSAISGWKHADEATVVNRLLNTPPYTSSAAQSIVASAAAIVERARADKNSKPLLDTFLSEYGLSNKEGIALLCLAESLLRIPDQHTADQLIADTVQLGDWVSHAGRARSALVNASTWGLMLTGKVVNVDHHFTHHPGQWLKQLASRVSEPVVRAAMRSAMRILSREFVLGRDIEHALKNSRKDGLYSYDMLGEAARDSVTAVRYTESYLHAIQTIGSNGHANPDQPTSISIKLSALHPRYVFSQRHRVLSEMVPILKQLCMAAAEHNVELTIDAEEADRLELSLDIFDMLARDSNLNTLKHLGLAVQAYSKRALPVLDWLIALSQETGRLFPVRLVKGAYWDAEIKHAQVEGLPSYPVFTRKSSSDVSYLVCARKILDHPNELYGQFATHNAHSIAALMGMASSPKTFEFQRLYGMGESLYGAAQNYFDAFPPLRVYAPVGPHDDLLAYLVRRLLENGANSSFVNRFLDEEVAAVDLVKDPIVLCRASTPIANPRICLPLDLYMPQRANSEGLDFSDAACVDRLEHFVAKSANAPLSLRAQIPGKSDLHQGDAIRNPANREDLIGHSVASSEDDIQRAFSLAAEAQPDWDAAGGEQRAQALFAAADALESERDRFITMLVREAGKTYVDAVAELREAIDFCRYYADQARRLFANTELLPGPTGESNELSLHGRGVFVCISPWNFPLAIFLGQITGALAAGNTVVAKPAPETPIIASEAVTLVQKHLFSANALQLITGGGEVGDMAVRHRLTAGLAFTGSTETAQRINLAMAQTPRAIVPLIAETGGQNAMVVDSSALLEQVTDDVMQSAFLSAGQRCSALRVLYLQEDIADAAIKLLIGAMNELRVGNPDRIETDIGPVISADAAASLQNHIEALTATGKKIHSTALTPECKLGSFVAPTLLEIEHINDLSQEFFGPVLHIIRFDERNFENVLNDIANCEFGLTFGIHSRIESRINSAIFKVGVGNVYVNRNITGAVVGSQPFGGQRLSGTGPKAGGPNYLLRFATERVVTVNTVARGGNAELLMLD